ncbi:MAG: recombination protein RecR [Paracoccaceae bacterium]|nr:MAG: recombination protein RecR [Alphaproteobacteria bacterium]GIX12349.1 MAG: recombination protein RecR [Paracoccaceae bacterium]
MADPAGHEIDRLIELMSRLPGLGPRSARRAVLTLLRRRQTLMDPLARALAEVAARVHDCPVCGNLATGELCDICADPRRDGSTLCVVEGVADLWALERAGVFRGRYHVLGGVLSALDGVGPEDLAIAALPARIAREGIAEVILALNATVEGQTTAHYLADVLSGSGVRLSALARGVPIGGELDHLDDGTIAAALGARRPLGG